MMSLTFIGRVPLVEAVKVADRHQLEYFIFYLQLVKSIPCGVWPLVMDNLTNVRCPARVGAAAELVALFEVPSCRPQWHLGPLIFLQNPLPGPANVLDWSSVQAVRWKPIV